MEKLNKAKLTEGNIAKHLVFLTLPMIFGMLGMMMFNIVDTFYVSRLGVNELAALSLTFPVVMIIANIALGLGIGTSALISRTIGKKDFNRVRRLTTDAIVLSVFIVAIFSSLGILTIKPVFQLLGAGEDILPLIKDYMQIWYLGMVFVVAPMVGNNAMRATGDTLTPAIIMLSGALLNLILDPIFIFPKITLPAPLFFLNIDHITIQGLNLGIKGAALATVFSRAITFCIAFLILNFKYKMLTFKLDGIKEIIKSWLDILFIGMPAAGTRIVIPAAVFFLTKIIYQFGKGPVSAYGIGTRIDFLSLAILAAMSTVIGPFVGQNWGAGKLDRVKKALNFSKLFSLCWGVFISILLFILAKPIARLFEKDPKSSFEVINNTINYLRIVPIAYGFQGIVLISSIALNPLRKPMHALFLTLLEMFVFCLPLALILSNIYNTTGVFIAISISYILTGVVSHFLLNRILSLLSKDFKEPLSPK